MLILKEKKTHLFSHAVFFILDQRAKVQIHKFIYPVYCFLQCFLGGGSDMEIERRILLGCLAPVRIPHAFRADRRTRFLMDLDNIVVRKVEWEKAKNRRAEI